MSLRKYKEFWSTNTASINLLKEDITDLDNCVVISQNRLADLAQSLEAMNAVGILVQKEFKDVIEELVTQALQYVYGDTHSFRLKSKIVRNQPEMYMYLVIDGEEFSPRDEEFSGGQADVVSFALRVILWAMQHDRSRATLIFDEPFKFLGQGDEAKAIGEMLLYLSETMRLQFIIITHNTGIVVKGMTRYNVKMTDGISEVSRVDTTDAVL